MIEEKIKKQIIDEIYKELYIIAEPSVDIEELVSIEECKEDFYLGYYLSDKRQNIIIKSILIKNNITKEEDINEIFNEIKLGYAPTTNREQYLKYRENNKKYNLYNNFSSKNFAKKKCDKCNKLFNNVHYYNGRNLCYYCSLSEDNVNIMSSGINYINSISMEEALRKVYTLKEVKNGKTSTKTSQISPPKILSGHKVRLVLADDEEDNIEEDIKYKEESIEEDVIEVNDKSELEEDADNI